MLKTYIDSLTLVSDDRETDFLIGQKRTCYNSIYPYKIFPPKELQELCFAPITVFYGGNGSGKTTLLNIIAEKANIKRHSAYNKSAFFSQYVSGCKLSGASIPKESQILTSDDVFDYLLDIRCLNDGIDSKREELFEDFLNRKKTPHQLKSMSEYEDWKESFEAKTKTQSRFVRERLMSNVEMHSNGESAMKYFVEHITENALYLLDEPENSLSVEHQLELCDFIASSAKYFGCQFILASHSPILLSLPDALIYDLDSIPVQTRSWTELENVKQYFKFFESHRSEFLKQD